jgi:hypothetical protein
MRQPYAHTAVLVMGPDGDVNAPGGAVTAGICGHWEHSPPCPLAPHFTSAERDRDEVRVRVLFAADSADEAEVRGRIEQALAAGSLQGTTWELISCEAAEVLESEAAHGQRLVEVG